MLSSYSQGVIHGPQNTKTQYPERYYCSFSLHRRALCRSPGSVSVELYSGKGSIRMLLLPPTCAWLCACPAHSVPCSHFSPPASTPHGASLPILVPRPGATASFPPQIILNAKCHAIRDAQILEKQLIQRELDAEEKRLDQMMEVERQKSIQRQEELDRKRREERIR